jgi:hypothetical protein
MWHVSGAAQSRTQFWPRAVGSFITLTWDQSTDPSVIGYLVFVGTDSRSYLGAYDVGNRTSFVYPHATVNRRHFFAVAAYSPGFVVGGLSDEVSGFGRIVPPPGHVPDFTVPPLGNGGYFGRCPSGRGDGCLESATVSASAGRISALTASAAGRVWFVEDKQQIFSIDLDGTVSQIERSARRRGQVEGLAVDPRVDETRRVYIQETDRLLDGSRELTISRYRLVMGTLRERAVIVSGVRLPSTGNVPFAVDGLGRVFVAVPRDRSGPRPHDGIVFAVQPDGTYLRGPSGLMSWRGLSNPSGLVWDPTARELWLSGADSAGNTIVERLPLTSQPQTPSTPTDTGGRYLLMPAPNGRLFRIDRRLARAEPMSLGGAEHVTAVTGGRLDVAFAATDSSGVPGSRIVVIPVAD